ncbi:hypothetical protein AAZX31_09G241100 [Glycine max]
MAEKCLTTNYYGAKETTEASFPLLPTSNSPRIVNFSLRAGQLVNIANEWAKGVLDDVENLTEERIALNSYTRFLAKKHPNMCINSVCPGFVKTDINRNTGIYSIDQGAANVVKFALLPDGSPSGLFYIGKNCQTSE